jgi:hypothetical protein
MSEQQLTRTILGGGPAAPARHGRVRLAPACD